ncbi:ABC transporter ATP-binding protein [Phormidium willei BDU 130791]|nr:ABC transporter ATP-binding protein [Phormidium willei BDU 130791]
MSQASLLRDAPAGQGDGVLSVEGIDVFYGASQILFGVGLEVARGRTLALLGRNGAGKSTTLKAIAGLAPPRRGRVRLHGADVAGAKPYAIARAGIGYVPEDRQVFSHHTVEDNLEIGAKPGRDGRVDWTLARVYEVFPLLAGMRGRQAGLLSGGEQQMLTIARTLMGNPDILLLDEPSEGLAPIIVQAIGGLIRQLREMGVTILLAEQNMHFCLGISEDAAVIDKGGIVFRGTIEALRADAEVTRRYLAI